MSEEILAKLKVRYWMLRACRERAEHLSGVFNSLCADEWNKNGRTFTYIYFDKKAFLWEYRQRNIQRWLTKIAEKCKP